MTATATDLTVERLDALRRSVEVADGAWFEALRDGGDAKAAKAVHKSALSEFRAYEAACLDAGLTVECGRCAGEGSVGWGNVFFNTERGSERTCFACHGARRVAVRKYRFDKQAPARYKAVLAHEAEEAAKRAVGDEKWAAFAAEHPAEAAVLADEHAASNPDEYGAGFFADLYEKVRRWGTLTEKQLAVVTREVAKRAAAPCPTGTVTVTGTIVGTYDSAGYGGGTKLNAKIALEGEHAGNTIGGTIPAKVWDALEDHENHRHAKLDGTRLRFTVTVKRSDRDEHFGFYKSPKAVEVLHVNWDEEE